MKCVVLSSFLIFIAIFSVSQPFKDEQKFKDYLIKNINRIDAIEGIWSGEFNVKTKFVFSNGESRNFADLSSNIRIIIYKENGYYNAYYSNKIIIDKDKYNEMRFEKTSSTSKYLFRYSGFSKKDYSGTAYLLNKNFLNFAVTDEDYNSSNNIKTIAEETYKLTKISLNEDDIKEALAKNPPTPDKAGGTAFAIGDRYIVTACHVVNGFNNFKVRGIGGNFNQSYNCILNYIDSINDMAVLYISDLNFQGVNNIPYSIKNSRAKVGEKAFALGYPLTTTMGEEIKLTDGIISSRSGFLGDTMQYQISVPVQPGNSGGPLFDNNGYLIGIVIAKHSAAENASYALKISCLKSLIRKRPTISTMTVSSQLINKDLPSKVNLIQKFVYIIEAEK